MSLIKCSECGKEVSNKAITCPNCGYNIKNNKYIVPTSIKVISFLFPIIGIFIYAINIGKNDKLSKESIKYSLYGIVTSVVISLIVLFVVHFLLVPRTIVNKADRTKNIRSNITEVDKIIVDNYVGKNYMEVKSKLESLGLEVKIVKKVNHFYETDIIVDQDPKSGTIVNGGDLVTLYVTK